MSLNTDKLNGVFNLINRVATRDELLDLLRKTEEQRADLERDNTRLREELDESKLHYGKVFIENENLRDENADSLLKIGDLNEVLSPFALFASALDGFDPTKNVRTIGVQGIRVSAFLRAAEVLSLPNA